MNLDRICLWIFPECDFSAWCELVGTPQVANYTEYLNLISAIQADQEHSGQTVVRVYFTVEEMKSALAAKSLENTPDNRATITALKS